MVMILRQPSQEERLMRDRPPMIEAAVIWKIIVTWAALIIVFRSPWWITTFCNWYTSKFKVEDG